MQRISSAKYIYISFTFYITEPFSMSGIYEVGKVIYTALGYILEQMNQFATNTAHSFDRKLKSGQASWGSFKYQHRLKVTRYAP